MRKKFAVKDILRKKDLRGEMEKNKKEKNEKKID